MIRHLFRLTWNRKRSTGLVFLELLGCFLVLCAVATGTAFTIDNWRRPLGFEYERRWRIQLDSGEFYRAADEQRRQVLVGSQNVLAEARALPDVEAAALMENSPYVQSTSSWSFRIDGREINVLYASVTPAMEQVLGLRLLRGRWLEEADAALDWRPAIVSENLARSRFGDADPLGKVLVVDPNRPPDPTAPTMRIVGVMADYRREGETRPADYTIFVPAHLDTVRLKSADRPPPELLVLARPGSGPRFEEDLVRHIHRIVPTWSVDVENLEQVRSRWLRDRLLPLLVAATVGGFLLLMVGFGLVGVLWQSVARRTSEIGLRRALGAAAGDVRLQIIGELVAVTTIAVAAGTLVFLQLPLLGSFGFLSWRVYLLGLAAAVAVLYCFVVVCALYPGWMATRVQPAQALQHE